MGVNDNVQRQSIKMAVKLKSIEEYKLCIASGYLLTIQDLQEILDCQRQYIQRFILNPGLVDYIAIDPMLRGDVLEYIRYLHGDEFACRYKRTKVLISMLSVADFLKENLIFKAKKICINLVFDLDVNSKGRKTKGIIKSNILSWVNSQNEKYKSRPRKISDDEIKDVVDNTLISKKTLKKLLKFDYDMQLERRLKTMNYVEYILLDNNTRLSFESSVIEAIGENNRQLEKRNSNEIEMTLQFEEQAYNSILGAAERSSMSIEEFFNVIVSKLINKIELD